MSSRSFITQYFLSLTKIIWPQEAPDNVQQINKHKCVTVDVTTLTQNIAGPILSQHYHNYNNYHCF